MPFENPEKTPRPTGKMRDRRLVFGAFLILLLVFGTLLVRMILKTTPVPVPPPAAVDQTPRQLREVILYFATPDGTRLVAEGREIRDCLIEKECLRETVQALLNGPVGDLAPILPSHAVLRGLEVSGSLLTLDFDASLVSGHPGGSQSELLSVFGLVDTLTVNFPHLRQVRFLVDGQPLETLKGHVDLRQPVSADFSLVEEGSAPPGKIRNLDIGGQE